MLKNTTRNEGTIPGVPDTWLSLTPVSHFQASSGKEKPQASSYLSNIMKGDKENKAQNQVKHFIFFKVHSQN